MITLIRGVPNTGKSTLAKKLNGLHLEADMYFVRNGEYKWFREGLSGAHKWCFEAFKKAVDLGMDVVVSNTFTTRKELKPYLTYALETKTVVKIIRLSTIKGDNGHNVSEEVLEKMHQRFQPIEEEETPDRYIVGGNKIE